MLFVVTPAATAAEEAPLTEWLPKIPTLTPACSKVSFSHLAIEDEDTGLCGLTATKNSFTAPSGRSEEVTVKYCLRVATGQSSLLCGKDGKKYSVKALQGLDCFANTAGRRVTPSGLK